MKKENIEDYAQEIASVLPKVIKWFHVSRATALVDSQLNPAQFFILDSICEKGLQKMSELAGDLQVSLPAITRMVDKLYVMKMVERVYDKEDRRIIRVKVTVKGEKVVAVFQKQRKQAFIEIFSQMSARDRRDYLRIIKKIYAITNKEER
ncbi:MAG: MarR family transcriptional regulator [Candidatus Omnitrophica bacterium]|nr:MarR family transcriptional regulator [Candidatus Omnitrophota bacterium]